MSTLPHLTRRRLQLEFDEGSRVLGYPKRVFSAAVRRFAALPVKILPAEWRARVLTSLNEGMISETAIHGGKVRFYAPSPLLRSRATSLLSKEPDTIRWIDKFKPDGVFWDVGANVGVFSLYAALRTGAGVLAFEPSAANFYVIARNIQLNGLAQRVAAYCLAFSATTQLGVLNLASTEMGSALSQFGQAGEMSRYADASAARAAHGMIGMSIDRFIAEFAPPFPNHLKMDVDGLELPILQGAQKTLADPRLKSLMVELSLTNRTEQEEALKILAERGWRLTSRGDSQGTAAERAANHFFDRG